MIHIERGPDGRPRVVPATTPHPGVVLMLIAPVFVAICCLTCQHYCHRIEVSRLRADLAVERGIASEALRQNAVMRKALAAEFAVRH